MSPLDDDLRRLRRAEGDAGAPPGLCDDALGALAGGRRRARARRVAVGVAGAALAVGAGVTAAQVVRDGRQAGGGAATTAGAPCAVAPIRSGRLPGVPSTRMGPWLRPDPNPAGLTAILPGLPGPVTEIPAGTGVLWATDRADLDDRAPVAVTATLAGDGREERSTTSGRAVGAMPSREGCWRLRIETRGTVSQLVVRIAAPPSPAPIPATCPAAPTRRDRGTRPDAARTVGDGHVRLFVDPYPRARIGAGRVEMARGQGRRRVVGWFTKVQWRATDAPEVTLRMSRTDGRGTARFLAPGTAPGDEPVWSDAARSSPDATVPRRPSVAGVRLAGTGCYRVTARWRGGGWMRVVWVYAIDG